MLTDNSSSGILTAPTEGVSRSFTEITILHQTDVHALYRAKRFGRWYMLKALHPEVCDDARYAQMLRKEMEILMQLQHPAIVGCLGLEYVADRPSGSDRCVGECIVMEYVDGQTLRQWLESEPDTPAKRREAERIMDEVLAAMDYAHSVGITHRDLKPSNIMLTRNGQNVRIIDFSLSDSDNYAILKQPAGTERYMSPEQATVALPDVRNDIYSLGVVMQQMPLPAYWRKPILRCLQPIGKRYARISDLREDISRRRTCSQRLRLGALVAALAIILALPGILGGLRSERMRRALLAEQNRVPNAIAAAVQKMDEQIAATGLTSHTDTLTHWRWLDPQFNDKVLAANAFAYDYTAQPFEGFSEDEMTDILVAMLDRWQCWHDSIVGRTKKVISESAP
ncbi:MAG: serine/threonine protein kinase [Bacteroidaceae bacterium]|nr:serine/threonine protein kinase [Bacteroidaceae bacterium]